MRLLCRGSGDPILFIHGIPTSNQLWSGESNGLLDASLALPWICLDWGTLLPDSTALSLYAGWRKRSKHSGWSMELRGGMWVGHDAGSAIAVSYAHLFQQHVDCLALSSPALFPELRPYFLFEILRKPVLGELRAPCINLLFWKLAMKRACKGGNDNVDQVLTDFYVPFSGPRGAWHVMRMLRWGKPSDTLCGIPSFLPQLLYSNPHLSRIEGSRHSRCVRPRRLSLNPTFRNDHR